MESQALEKETRNAGVEIYNRAKASEPEIWEALWWERRMVKWLSADPEVKSRAMRFIDVFPALKSNRDIARHIREYLPGQSSRLPGYLRLGQAALQGALLTPGAAALATSAVISKVARWFIAGASDEDAPAVVESLRAAGMTYTLDLLGEATLSEAEGEAYAQKYIALINRLAAAHRPGWPSINVSVKLSALTPRLSPVAPEESSRLARERLRGIFRAAQCAGAAVNLDMENYALRDLTLRVFMDLLEEKEFSGFTGAGIVAQAYLKDAEESLEKLLDWTLSNNRQVCVRLVKGAYWEQETVWASQKGWEPPVRQSKADTDAAFERMAMTLLSNHRHVITAVASHNIRSLARGVALARAMKVPAGRFEAQMLYGMAGEVKKALTQMGIPLRVYAPLGQFLPGMAYLVRRILENSSNESFLRQSFVEERPVDELLADPARIVKSPAPDAPASGMGGEVAFVNEPEPKFHVKGERMAMDNALRQVGGALGRRYRMIIDGKEIGGSQTIRSVNPADPESVVGEAPQADTAAVEAAMDAAGRAFPGWAAAKPETRGEILRRVSDIIAGRKHELAAWQIYEVGKTRAEALADVNEAIDHLRFYALQAQRAIRAEKTDDALGEVNVTRLIPRGPGVVISPWNFPLAILAGMTASALAAGNTVTLKPSSLSPVTAALFAGILMDAGIPDGAVNLVFGSGQALGGALVGHPRTTFVMFTGSYETGLWLARACAEGAAGRDGFIKLLAELGGKNAVIVDSSADLDSAVAGVVQSAFGFGGQKCSACSRVVVLDGVYQEFSGRLVEAVRSLKVAAPADPSADFGPLIDQAAVEKARAYVKLGAGEGRLLLAPGEIPAKGYFSAPAVFGDVSPGGRLAQEEIFGPVLSLIRAQNLDEAIAVANGVKYALTGGVYSRTPSSIVKVRDQFRVGNLYINRGITGAVVRRQPFGGFKRSGLGTAKAGGADMIRELSLAQTVSENIVRHGFSPDVGG